MPANLNSSFMSARVYYQKKDSGFNRLHLHTHGAYPSKKSFVLSDYGNSSPVEMSHNRAESRSYDLHVVGVPKECSEPAPLAQSRGTGGIGNLKIKQHTSHVMYIITRSHLHA